jgi:hypothetical protein
VLISSSHPQILVPWQLRHGVNVCTLHSQPACSHMPQVVETEIQYLQTAAESRKCAAYLFWAEVAKYS